jgi:hypothetical protein
LLVGAGMSSHISSSSKELQRHRLLLDGAASRSGPPASFACLAIAGHCLRVLLAPAPMRIRMFATPGSMVLAATSEVAGVLRQPRRLIGCLALALALLGRANPLSVLQPWIREKPTTAQPAGPLAQ